MKLEILPNLMVNCLESSIDFYCRVLSMEIQFVVDGNREVVSDHSEGVFAILKRDDSGIMIQTRESLLEELPQMASDKGYTANCTLYFRNIEPSEVLPKLDKEQILKGPFVQWYGMKELYFSDPDGHIICAGCLISNDL